MKGKLPTVLILIVLYFVSTGVSFAIFKYTGTGSPISSIPAPSDVNPGSGFKVDQTLPKTEACPLNGKLYTTQEKAVWETRRPMGVMMENSTEARPHSGLSKADIVYEAVAEGGITRFMGIFYCGVAENTEFAPVRSARTYFVDWISEYATNPLYVHVGGGNCSRDQASGKCTSDPRAQAIEQMDNYGWRGVNGNDMDQMGLNFPICYRNPDRLDHPVATEHQMVCQSELLFNEAQKRGWTNVDAKGAEWSKTFTPWKFTTEAKETDRGTVTDISMYFWKGYTDYEASWHYDSTTNHYLRSTGGKAHYDKDASVQLSAKNVVVQFSKETGPVDEHKHLLYQTTGTGDALFFQNGQVVEGKWSKKTRTSRTIFTDSKGKEIIFVPGSIWIEIIPDGNKITY